MADVRAATTLTRTATEGGLWGLAAAAAGEYLDGALASAPKLAFLLVALVPLVGATLIAGIRNLIVAYDVKWLKAFFGAQTVSEVVEKKVGEVREAVAAAKNVTEAAKDVTKVGIAFLVAFVMMGCAGAGGSMFSEPREKALAKILVQNATLRVIDGQPDRAAKVLAALDQVLADVEPNQTVTAETLAAAAKGAVPWEKLNESDQQLVSALIDLAAAEVATRVPRGEVNVPIAEVQTVLEWIEEAARIAAPPEPEAS